MALQARRADVRTTMHAVLEHSRRTYFEAQCTLSVMKGAEREAELFAKRYDVAAKQIDWIKARSSVIQNGDFESLDELERQLDGMSGGFRKMGDSTMRMRRALSDSELEALAKICH